MRNTLKLFCIIALIALIGFSMTSCGGNGNECECSDPCLIPNCSCLDCPGNSSGDGCECADPCLIPNCNCLDCPGNTSGNECDCDDPCLIPDCDCTDCSGDIPIDGSIDFTGPMWNDLDVYRRSDFELYDGEDIIFDIINVIVGFFESDVYCSFSDVSNNPENWEIKITNNKLSIKLGIPDKIISMTSFPEGIIATSGLELVMIGLFVSNIDDDLDLDLQWRDPYALDMVSFFYANKAGTVKGEFILYDEIKIIMNLDLKQGWNTVISNYNEDEDMSIYFFTGVPESNDFMWYLYL